MARFKAIISYNGASFCGWQKQRGSAAEGAPSIQESIENAISQISGESPSLVGSGRTDAGVHALGQVAHFDLKEKIWAPHKIRLGLNSALPKEIRIQNVIEVDESFHAQRSAEWKQYSYYLFRGREIFPFIAPYSWWVRRELDFDKMRCAMELIIGEHDFAAFQNAGASVLTTTRTIYEAQIDENAALPFFYGDQHDGDSRMIRITVRGSGFLKQMVRNIVGTLVEVGDGKRDLDSFRDALQSLDRSQAGPSAPGKGLFLEKVAYPDSN